MSIDHARRFEATIRKDLQSMAVHGGLCRDPNCLSCEHLAAGVFQAAMRHWEQFLVDAIVNECFNRGTYSSQDEAHRHLRKLKYDNKEQKITEKRHPSDYILLHDPVMVAAVADHLSPGGAAAKATAATTTEIRRLVHLRHGISHGTDDAQRKARAAMLDLAPMISYRSPGAYLAHRAEIDSETNLFELLSQLIEVAYLVATGSQRPSNPQISSASKTNQSNDHGLTDG